MSEYRVTFAGLSVIIQYSTAEVREFLKLLFNDVHGQDAGDYEAILKISQDGNSGQYMLTTADEEVLFRGYLGVHFAAILFDSVIFNLLNKNSRGVAFHAGAVALQEKVILLPGQSGSGKSTMSAWLAAHDFSYLTDELLFMPDGEPDMAIPFTRPVCIKSGSAGEIKKYIQGDRSGILEDKEGIIVAHRSLNPDFSIITSAPSLILFPVYQFSSPLKIHKITGAQACTLLMECDVNARNLADHGFKQIVRIARSIPAYQVIYGSFDGFGDALAELFDELHWQ